MSSYGNAEGSSSRLPRSIVARRKSQDALKRAASAAAASPAAPASQTKSGDKATELQRAVRTVPPGAAYEPPTPPTPSIELLPETSTHKRETTGGTATTTATQKRRRAPRVKYDTSESSAGSADGETSDEEPPWWTFTQRGTAKLRARMMRHGEEGAAGPSGISGGESGKDSGKESRRRRGSRQNSKEGKQKTPNSSRPGSVHRLQSAANIRGNKQSGPNSLLWRRSIGRELPLPHITLGATHPMARSNSAPSSPLRLSDEIPISPGLTTIVASSSTEEARLNDSLSLAKPNRPTSSRVPILSPKRQLTTPNFPKFRKRSDQDVHTDTEALGSTGPRAKLREKERLQENMAISASAPSRPSEEGSSTPTRPRAQRRATNRIKIALPEPISQHFAEGWQKGWPHAGTWQDAYYGHYAQHCDSPGEESASAPRKAIADSDAPSSRRSSGQREQRRASKSRYETPEHSESNAPPSPAQTAAQTQKRSRRIRSRRYRQALAPPTPSGLGFTPNGSRRDGEAWKEGRVGASDSGYNWDNRQSPATNDDLDRSETTVTNEKDAEAKARGWFSMFNRGKPEDRRDDVGWRKRARRMLFLDARVTILIRLINLTFVLTSLALAVRIRLQLANLLVPGLMGASTTLLISFSSLTALHVLTAIYREWFGKPIGLWGLRSKMLWVCLDLAFIAFWAASASLAVNDFISTPLDCSEGTPWWRSGLANDYAELLQTLQLSSPSGDITPAEMITHSLGIVLPIEITNSPAAKEICDKQIGSIALALLTLMLYTGNMVLSLFRIFETVRRTANVDRAVIV